jgi:hypothetical protein
MPPSGAFVLGIIAILLAFIILLVVGTMPQNKARETVEETHLLRDGRTVTCLVIPSEKDYSISCDWMTASVLVK